MFCALKITTQHEMSNDTLWPPWGWSFSITVETKMVPLSRLTVEQAPWQMQMCGNRSWTSSSFPSVAPSQGASKRAHSCHSTHGHGQHKRETFRCVVCRWTPDPARDTTQQVTDTQRPRSLWSTFTPSCQKDRKGRKLQTSNPGNPDKRWKTVTKNRISSHKDDGTG